MRVEGKGRIIRVGGAKGVLNGITIFRSHPAILCVSCARESFAGEFKRLIYRLRSSINFARNSFAFTRQISNRERLQSPARIEDRISISSIHPSKINFFIRSRINPTILLEISFTEESLARHVKIVTTSLDIIGTFTGNAITFTRQIGDRVGNNPMRIENQIFVFTIRCANIIRKFAAIYDTPPILNIPFAVKFVNGPLKSDSCTPILLIGDRSSTYRCARHVDNGIGN